MIMKKILTISFIVLIVLLVVIILIPVVFKSKLKKIAEEEANNNVNAKIAFADFNVSIFKHFPSISVELTNLSVAGVKEFEGDTLIKFKTLFLNVNLWSVIAGDQIEINAVELNQPTMYIKVLKGGKANYDIAKDTASSPQDTAKSEPSKFKVGLKRVSIINGNIIYSDADMDMMAQIEKLNFNMSGDLTEETTDLKIATTIDSLTFIYSGVKYLKKVKIDYVSNFITDMKNWRFTFKENLLKLNEIEIGFDGFVEMPTNDIGMDIKFAAKKNTFKTVLSLVPAVYLNDFKDVKTDGKFTLNGYVSGLYNDSIMPAYGIDLLVENAYFKYPALPKSVENINVLLKVDNEGGTGDNMTIDLKKAHIEIAQNPIDAKILLKMTKKDVAMSGNVAGKVDLISIKDVMPLTDMSITGLIAANISFAGNLSSIEKERYNDFKADGKLEISDFVYTSKDMPAVTINKSVLSFTPKNLSLESFDALIGKSDIKLNGKVDNILQYVFKDELLTANFVLTSNVLDLNEFMTNEETPQAAQVDTTKLTAFEIPQNINFKLASRLSKILMMNMQIENLTGNILLSEGKATLDKVKANLLKGTALISGSYDSKNIKKPAIDFDMNLSNIDIPETFATFITIQKLAPIAQKCSGNISAKFRIALVMDYFMNPQLNTLNSEGNFKSASIGLNKSNLFEAIANATKIEKYRNPSLNNVDISYLIKDGNLTLKPTKLNIAGTEATIDGTQNLNQNINYNISLMVPQESAAKVLNKLPMNNAQKNIDLNLVIGGTVTNPKIVKIRSSLFDNAKDMVDDKINEVKKDVKAEAQKLIDEANTKAQQLISEAEKQAQVIKEAAQKTADNIMAEAEKQGQVLIDKASNPIAKRAAEETVKKLKKDAQQKVDKLMKETDNQVNTLVEGAKSKADKMIQEAQDKANSL